MGACELHKSIEAAEITSRTIASWSSSGEAYSGDWNTCNRVVNRIKYADVFKPAVVKQLYKDYHADKIDIRKWSSTVIDCGVVGYEVWSLKKGKPSGYEVIDAHGRNNGHFDELKEAEAEAQKLTQSTGELFYVQQWKTSFYMQKTQRKSMPKKVRAGAVVKAIHHFEVFGMASC